MFVFLQQLNEIPYRRTHLSSSRCLHPQEQRMRKRHGKIVRPFGMSAPKTLEEKERPEESRAGGGFHISSFIT